MSSSSISNLIKNDHNTVNELYKNYLHAQGNPNDQQRYAQQFQEELTKHSTAEEMILYPAFEQYLGAEGKKIADEDRAEHEKVKKLLHSLKSTSVTDPQHPQIFDELMKNLLEHVKGEENNDLPKFEKAITAELSASLAQTFQQAKIRR